MNCKEVDMKSRLAQTTNNPFMTVMVDNSVKSSTALESLSTEKKKKEDELFMVLDDLVS